MIKKMKWITPIVIVVLIIIRIVWVNVTMTYAQLNTIHIAAGESWEKNDCTYKIKNYEVLDVQESIEKYGINDNDKDIEKYILFVDLDVTYHGKEEQYNSKVVELCVERGAFKNGIEFFGYMQLNPNGVSVKAGETKTIKGIWTLPKVSFSTSHWNNVKELDYKLVDNQFPNVIEIELR